MIDDERFASTFLLKARLSEDMMQAVVGYLSWQCFSMTLKGA